MPPAKAAAASIAAVPKRSRPCANGCRCTRLTIRTPGGGGIRPCWASDGGAAYKRNDVAAPLANTLSFSFRYGISVSANVQRDSPCKQHYLRVHLHVLDCQLLGSHACRHNR